jgi:phenylacetate-CoA ligase
MFDDAGVDPRRFRGVDDLRRLPFTTRADLASAQAQGAGLELALRPGAIREHWGFSRKLALVLGGRKAAEALRLGYAPALVLQDRQRGEPTLELTLTQSDVDVLGEVGARAVDLLGLAPSARLLSAVAGPANAAFWVSTLGAVRSGRCLRTEVGAPGELLDVLESWRPNVLLAPIAVARRLARSARSTGRDLSALNTLVVDAEGTSAKHIESLHADLAACGADGARVARAWIPPVARLAFVESPISEGDGDAQGGGIHLMPDLCVVEVIDPISLELVAEGQPGELVITTLCGHGTAVLRYRTGCWAAGGVSWSPCPVSGRTLPRVLSELKPLPEPGR